MPAFEELHSPDRKRKRTHETEHLKDACPASSKRVKHRKQQRHKTPSSFWDNLSRLRLTRRALREFDRRTSPPHTAVRPQRVNGKTINTRELTRFAQRGGPDLGGVRAYPEPEKDRRPGRTMPPSKPTTRKRTHSPDEAEKSSRPRTSKTSVYDPDFEQHLIDHGVFPADYDESEEETSVYPDNLENINARLAERRTSLSPSRFPRKALMDFRKVNAQAHTEQDVMSTVFPMISGNSAIPSTRNVQFSKLAHLTNGDIKEAQPDLYDGARPAKLKLEVRKLLGRYIVPSSRTSRPCLPNFFAEAKGPNGNAAVCKRQACYDGAMGARAMHELRSHVDPATALDNNAYAISSTYHGGTGTLTLYATHPTASKKAERSVDYHMTQLDSFAMTGNPASFRKGALALRNARCWARERRDELIAAANRKQALPNNTSTSEESNEETTTTSQTTVSPSHDSHTLLCELAAD